MKRNHVITPTVHRDRDKDMLPSNLVFLLTFTYQEESTRNLLRKQIKDHFQLVMYTSQLVLFTSFSVHVHPVEWHTY